MVYLQSTHQLTNVSFQAMREAVMAEFEHTTCSSTIAVNKISAVKRKGKSPAFSEQKYAPNQASPAPVEPSGSQKKKRKGGKGKAWAHEIVSSVLIPQAIAKQLQETHHIAPAATMPPRPVTVVGGPSRVPAIIPAASTIASFKPSGVTYTKATLPSLAQAFTGRSGSPSLFTYKQALMTKHTPPIQRDPAVAQQEALVAINHKLKAKEVCTSIIENAVASSSAVMLDEAPLKKLTLEEHIQTPTPDDYAAYVERQRQKRRRNWAAKKEAAKAAKLQQPAKEPEAPASDIVSNNQSLYETWQSLQDHIQDMSNPRSEENSELLFQELLQNHQNPFNVNKVNPWHPKYGYYTSLISDLQVWDEYMDSVISDPEDDRPVGGKRKSSWKKPCVHGPFDNELDSYAYDNYGYLGMPLTY